MGQIEEEEVDGEGNLDLNLCRMLGIDVEKIALELALKED